MPAHCTGRSRQMPSAPLLAVAALAVMLHELLYCAALSAPPSSPSRRCTNPLTPGQLERITQYPHVGYIADDSTEVFVIGTSHFRCNSAQEVSTLIEEVRPDGVVLELDPERVLRLTKQYAGFDENGIVRETQPSDELLYGADFSAAVNACQQMDIPLFLGDEYAQETKQRIAQQILNWRAYSPVPLLQSILASLTGDVSKRKARLNLLEIFWQDPQKLTPIVVTSSPPFVLSAGLAFFDNGAMAYDGSAISNAADAILSIVASAFASCLLFNTVIAERDEILAASTRRASNVVRSLKDDTSIRKRWEFTVEKETNQQAGEANVSFDALPLFTLKTPLLKNAVRNLNLFEPRWLKMIDEVTRNKDLSDDKIFGCVRCTNKFYSALSVDGKEGRYADVIFEKVGTYAKILSLTEGKRPVSGDRRIGVRIEGGDSFVVDESNSSVTRDGYMIATNVRQTSDMDDGEPPGQERSATSVRLVVVVGLLHGNGVVDVLSKAK
ncbi:hypothetical protein ACHAXT_006882 [Thalassiosira profunda]